MIPLVTAISAPSKSNANDSVSRTNNNTTKIGNNQNINKETLSMPIDPVNESRIIPPSQ